MRSIRCFSQPRQPFAVPTAAASAAIGAPQCRWGKPREENEWSPLLPRGTVVHHRAPLACGVDSTGSTGLTRSNSLSCLLCLSSSPAHNSCPSQPGSTRALILSLRRAMFGATIAIAVDEEMSHQPEHDAVVPVGLGSLVAAPASAYSSSGFGSPAHSGGVGSGGAAGSQHDRQLSASSIGSVHIVMPGLDESGQTVSKEGFLHKIGGNVKNWKTRYFRLHPGRLNYYKDGGQARRESGANDGAGSCGGTQRKKRGMREIFGRSSQSVESDESSRATLTRCSASFDPWRVCASAETSDRLGSILLPGATLAVFAGDVYLQHPYCFGITPADGDRQYILDCDSTSHRSQWIAAIQAHMKQRIQTTTHSLREGHLVKQGGTVKNWSVAPQTRSSARRVRWPERSLGESGPRAEPGAEAALGARGACLRLSHCA